MERVKCCNSENYELTCPILNAHDKYEECCFFLAQMLYNYHFSRIFRFHLNAFIKSFREITLMLQTYKGNMPLFDEWYAKKQAEMSSDRILKWLKNSRNTVVHEDMLKTKSKVEAGVFRGRTLKLAIVIPIDNPFVDSCNILQKIKSFGFVDEAHSAIGEQYGVRRIWNCDGLNDDDEMVSACSYGFDYMGKLLEEVHEMMGYCFTSLSLNKNLVEDKYVLLESDLDPTLINKWGWQ